MSFTHVQSVIVIIFVVLSLSLFLAGSMIDRGRRHSAKNAKRSEKLVKCAIYSTVLSWLFAIALAVFTLA